jgi:CubicO group peptidase (beta-lactamase class C family)
MVSRLAGEDWEVYLQKNVLSPLGMTHAYFDVTPYHLLKDRSNNYYARDGVTTANGLDFDTGITVSNGGLNAPLADLAKYLRFLLGATPGEANPIARATLEEMWQVQAPSQAGEVLGTGVGLGYFIEQRGEVRLIGHTGSQAGFRSFFWIHPESGLGIIANFNTAPATESGAGVRPDIGRVFQGMLDQFVGLVRAGAGG